MQTEGRDTNPPARGGSQSGLRSRPRSGMASRRVVWSAFGISAVVHVLAIALYPTIGTIEPENARLPFPDFSTTPEGLQVLRLIELAQASDPERPEDPDEIEEIESPDVETISPTFDAETGVDLEPPPPSGAELLRPRLTDERLWRPIDPSLTGLTLQQREELALRAGIADWYDSLSAAQAAESRLTDWTYTDDDGKRWGVADGKIYLGDVVLPGTHLFGVPVGKRDEVARRTWQWDEITRQAARYDVESAWRDRQAAIRERRDRERAALPDTTRSRR